jgi:hypothetical protein
MLGRTLNRQANDERAQQFPLTSLDPKVCVWGYKQR